MALPAAIVSRPLMQPIPKLKRTASPPTASPTCTHTFDAWRNFAVSYAAQRNVSGKYGVDFRFAPEPSGGERRTLKLLDTAAKCLGPGVLKRSAVQFDFIENTNARAQNNFPCAQPNAHVHPFTSSPSSTSQQPFQARAQSQIQQTISTSSSATPRASPEQERPQVRLQYTQQYQQQQQDPLHDIFFNFDLASPSEASAPPDTDGEQEHDTEGTDTESERDLRLSDLEGPVALRRRATRGRRARAGSMSTNSTGSGPAASPVSPTADNVRATYSSTNPDVPASAFRPAYARRSSVLSPAQNQVLHQAPSQPQSQPISGVSPQFPTSVSESGASPSSAGIGSVGLSAAARARMRGRGIGASRSEPDPDVTPTNTAGATAAGPSGGGIQLGGGSYSVGPYGYRYPMHPPYPAPVLDASASQVQAHAQEYASPTGLGTVKEESPNSILNWQASTSTVGMEAAMDIDVEMGGWGKVSEPLPGMNLAFGMHYTLPYAAQSQSQTHTTAQTNGTGTYTNGTYSQPSPYTQHAPGTFGAQMSYYTSQTSNTSVNAVNPSLNMSSSRWKGTTESAGGNTASLAPALASGGVGRQNRALSLSHVQGLDSQRAAFWSSRNNDF